LFGSRTKPARDVSQPSNRWNCRKFPGRLPTAAWPAKVRSPGGIGAFARANALNAAMDNNPLFPI
jgi:hypothetical protein